MSNRLRQCPEWVIDAVLVHELAHLQEVGHTPRFYEIADRFEQQEESAVFLEATRWASDFESKRATSTSTRLTNRVSA